MSQIISNQVFDDGSSLVQFENGDVLATGARSTPNLKFPLNLFSRSESISPAYVKFNVLEVEQDRTLASTIESTGNAILTGAKEIGNLQFGQFGTTLKDTVANWSTSAQTLASARLKTQETGTTIAMYMPPAIQINDSMAYDTVDTKGVSEIFAQFARANDKGEFITDFLQGAGANMVSQHMLTKYSRTGGILSGTVANALIASGKVANPATKLLFRSPSLRQLQLDFRLAPTSQKEAAEITKIVSVFRQAAYPALDLSSYNALYNVPNLFNIKFAFKNKDGNANPYMIQFKRCYLTQVTTTYNGSGVPAFFNDGSPVETNLTLTFQETETNSAADIHGSGNTYISAGPASGGPGKPEKAMY